MSTEALAFAKITELDAAESDGARLLFYVIAENTFNDTCLCKVGQAELVYQTRGKLRSVQRRIAAMEEAGKIKVTRQGGEGRGRKPDLVEIVGFRAWLSEQRLLKGSVSRAAKPKEAAEQPANLAPCSGEQAANLASCQIEQGNPPNSQGQPAKCGGYRRTRTSTTRTRTPPLPPEGEGVSKSENLKVKGKAMDCAISPEARSEARTLAPGWDIRELEREWREWNEAQDNVVKDPDRAFLAFCRKRGAHKAARKFKLTTKVSPELRALVLVAGPDERIIDRLGPHWQPWLDHLRREAPDLERQASRSFAMAVKSQRPYPGCDLPRIQPMPTTA